MLSASAPTNLASSVSSSNGVSANDANVQGTPREDAGGASHPAVLDAFSINPSSLLSAGDLPHPTIAVTPPPTAATTNPTQQGSSKLLGTLTKAAKNSALPTAICAYYLNSVKGIGQGCLRVNCKFFHGTEEQLAELRIRCMLDEPLAAGMSAVCAAKCKKPTSELSSNVKRPIVCLNYLTDTCHRPGCRFLHLPPEIRPLPMTTCEYFLRGNCTRCRCRFFHGTQAVLTSLHAQGVTMYNPSTCMPYDPKVSVEALLATHARTNALPQAQPSSGGMGMGVPSSAPHHVMPPAQRNITAYHPSHPFPPPPSQPSNTVFVVVDSATNTVQMHTVTTQADGAVVIVSPGQHYSQPTTIGAHHPSFTGRGAPTNSQYEGAAFWQTPPPTYADNFHRQYTHPLPNPSPSIFNRDGHTMAPHQQQCIPGRIAYPHIQ